MADATMTYSRRPGSREGVEILSLAGPFTLNNIFQLQRDLQEMKPPCMIFDVAKVPYMDSAGLGLLVNFYASAQKDGRRMAVAGATTRLTTLFEMTRVDGLIGLYRTIEEAEAAS